VTATVLRFRRRPSEEDVVGTCGWGGCDRDTAALRWDGDGFRWLSVCSRHAAPPWVRLPSVPSPP
jgi:hypothetical protein